MFPLFISTHPQTLSFWEATFQQFLPDAEIFTSLEILQDHQKKQSNAHFQYVAILWNTTDQVWDWVLSPETQPKAIFLLGAGVDKVLNQINQRFQISKHHLPPIIRLEDAGMADSMVEYALYAVLESFRGYRVYRKHQINHQWQSLLAPKKEQFPVGVLGLGALGQPVAMALRDLGFPVFGWSRNPHTLPGVECEWGEAGLNQVLTKSKLIILLLPLTNQTLGLLNSDKLKLLQPGTVLVNLARGALIDEQALLNHLEKDPLAHCYLDVFTQEPLPEDHPFWSHEQVTLTPHVAAQTKVEPGVEQIVEKLVRLEQGLTVSGVVDVERGY